MRTDNGIPVDRRVVDAIHFGGDIPQTDKYEPPLTALEFLQQLSLVLGVRAWQLEAIEWTESDRDNSREPNALGHKLTELCKWRDTPLVESAKGDSSQSR